MFGCLAWASERPQSPAGETASNKSVTPASTSSATKKTGAVKHPTTPHPTTPKYPRGSTQAARSSATARTSPAARRTSRRYTHKSKSRRVRGQQKIDSERARSIQEALIREHYMSGEPTGAWDQESEDAMRRYQGDHGWQTKEVPDSRALIQLGLGPSNDHLLNPESAMTSTPVTPRAEPQHASADAPGTTSDPHTTDGHNAPPVQTQPATQTAPAAPSSSPTQSPTSDSPRPQ
jgi:hypothetical protein